MTHYAEHELELYVLKDEAIHDRRASIESHLSECVGCRDLVTAMVSFYGSVGEEGKSLSRGLESRGVPAVRRARGVKPLYRPISAAVISGDRRLSDRVVRFARSRPVAAVAGAGGIGLLLLAVLLMFNRMGGNTGNPAYAIAHAATGELRVYDERDILLWSKPATNLNESVRSGPSETATDIEVADLDGDGLREVITSLTLGDDRLHRTVHILDSRGILRAQIPCGEPVVFRGRQYPDDYYLTWFTTNRGPDSAATGIITCATNRNSPTVIARYDREFRRVGTYWHFGHLGLLLRLDVDGDGRKEILAFGYNDSAEEGTAQAVLIVLDPEAITGDTESRVAGGFGKTPSPAEKACLLVPRSAIAQRLGRDVVLKEPLRVKLNDGTGFRVIAYGSSRNEQPVFEYIFNHSLGVVEVKSSDYTKRIYDSLAVSTSLPTDFYDGYLRSLAAEVRYWDGRGWSASRTVTSVHAF